MKKLALLSNMIGLNRTVSEAVEYMMKSIPVNPDANAMAADIKDALASISANVSLVFDEARSKEILQQSARLQRSCDTLLTSSKSADAFHKEYVSWNAVSDRAFYLEAVNAANTADEDEAAIGLLEKMLTCDPPRQYKALAEYVLCRKLSDKQPLEAYNLGLDAFDTDNALASRITQENARVHGYVYTKVAETYFEACPICRGAGGAPYYCATPLFMSNYTADFSPVKLWMKCASCGQLYAYNFPRKLAFPEPDTEELGDEIYMSPRPEVLPIIGRILKNVLSRTGGRKLLEVGAGTGELIAAALELGCQVTAVDISKRQTERLRRLLEVDVRCMDFTDYDTAEKYSIVTMGDVIEHVSDPVAVIKKAHGLLEDEGILWISTPNFESGFSRIMKFGDPMWNEPWHITYFSYDGFRKILDENGFDILDYEISARYNGSMEITAKKRG